MNTSTSTIQSELFAAFAGTVVSIDGHKFIMNHIGELLDAVTLHDGAVVAADEACLVGDEYHPIGDCYQTIDGTYALVEDCNVVYSGFGRQRWCASAYYTETQLAKAKDNDEVRFCDSRGEYYTAAYCTYLPDSDTYEHLSDCVEIGGDYYLTDDERLLTDGHGDRFLEGDEDYVWCRASYEYYPITDCHKCGGEWMYGDEDYCDECNRGPKIYAYHKSPNPDFFRGTSGWLVGFEVEKISVDSNSDEGDYVEETPLFTAWETDSSCGVEGITHCYDPIDPVTVDLFRRHVNQSSTLLDEDIDKSCGGHINLSSRSIAPEDLLQEFRNFAGLFYALYKGRLSNTYCNGNKLLSAHYGGDRYAVASRKPFGIEIRLVSAVPNSDVLLRRFDLIGELCRSIDEGRTFNFALQRFTPILLDAYSNDRQKVAQIIRLSRHFQRWLNTDGSVSHPSIAQYV